VDRAPVVVVVDEDVDYNSDDNYLTEDDIRELMGS